MASIPIISLVMVASFLSFNGFPFTIDPFSSDETDALAEGVMLPLVFTEVPETISMYDFGRRHFAIDEDGMVRTPFPTPSGELLLRVGNGCLQVDCNGDGTIDEKEDRFYEEYEIFHVTVVVAGKNTDYPMFLRRYTGKHIILNGRAALLGNNNRYQVLIYDADLDGILGEYGEDHFKLVPFSAKRLDAALEDGEHPFWFEDDLPMGRYGVMGEEIFELKILGCGRALELFPRLEENSRLTIDPGKGTDDYTGYLAHEDGLLYQSFKTGEELTLVPGAYHVERLRITFGLDAEAWCIERKQKPSSRKRFAYAYGVFGENRSLVKIVPGKNTFRLGLPLILDMDAIRWGELGDRIEIQGARLVGIGRETYRFDLSGHAHRSSLKIFFRLNDREQYVNDLQYG